MNPLKKIIVALYISCCICKAYIGAEKDIYKESYDLASDLVIKKLGSFKIPSLKLRQVSVKELKAFDLPFSAHSVRAFYVPSKNVIYLNTKIFSSALSKLARSNTEKRAIILSTLVHELIHAYQFSQLGESYKKMDKLFLRFLCEGHAVYMTETICMKKEIPERLIKSGSPTRINRRLGNNYAINLHQNMSFFYYTLGAKFSKRCLDSKMSFADMIKLKIDFQQAFDMGGEKLSFSDDMRANQNNISSAITTICGNKGRQFNYLESITFLTPGRITDKQTILGFDQSLGWKTDTVEILLVSFSSVKSTEDVFLYHLNFLNKYKFIDTVDALKAHGILSRDYPNKNITSLSIQLENCIVIVSSNDKNSALKMGRTIHDNVKNIKK